MRCLIIAMPLIAALALAGCNKEPEGPKTAEQVKDQASAIVKPQPGQYRTTMKITNFSIPGMPADKAAQMKGMFSASGKSTEFCLSPADADKGFEEFSKRMAQGKCSFDQFNATSGTLDAKMTCQTGQGMTGTYEMHGSFSATGSKMAMKVNQSAPGQMAGMPGAGMMMEAEVTNERIGNCS
jgi:hypothetical protein